MEEEKLKVGIITQPLYANYGGILQNYALQQVLKKMGHSPITLDYMPSLSFFRYLLYAGKGVIDALIPNRHHPIKLYKHFLERPANIESFVRNNIELTKTIAVYNKSCLKKNGIEALIVGSDQVWRYSYNSHYIEDMYLAFAKDYLCRKIVYGASFGVEMWDYPQSVTDTVRELVKQFDTISVRENTGADLCWEGLGVEAQTVLDPTLLLQASDYEQFCSAPDPKEPPYLAAYVLDRSEEKNAYIKSIAETNGLHIKEMTVSVISQSIEEWLSTIRNSDFIITDSYHGSLFSILFQKQFITILNKERGADRFITTLSSLGLKEHIIDTSSERFSTIDPIDYSGLESILAPLRKSSISFLRESLKQ